MPIAIGRTGSDGLPVGGGTSPPPPSPPLVVTTGPDRTSGCSEMPPKMGIERHRAPFGTVRLLDEDFEIDFDAEKDPSQRASLSRQKG